MTLLQFHIGMFTRNIVRVFACVVNVSGYLFCRPYADTLWASSLICRWCCSVADCVTS